MINLIEKVPKIPNDWNVDNAKGQLLLISGQRPSDMVTDDPNDVSSLGGENITSDGFLTFNNLRFISKYYFEKTDKGKLRLHDILINKDGANTGKIALYDKNYFEKALVNEHVFIIRNKGKFYQPFLYYFLLSFYGQKQIQSRVTGSAQGGLNTSFTKGLALITPPLPEQRAIASILSKVDEEIEATENSIKATENLKKSLMQNLLTGKLKLDGTWRKEEEFKETKIGLFPNDWEVKKVKDVSIQVTDGEHTTPKRSEKGYYLLSARNVKNGYLDLIDVDYLQEDELRKIQKRCNPQPGDILISCSGTIGNVCIVPEGLDAGMVRSVALIKLKKGLLESEFAEIVFQSYLLQKQMKVSVSSSVQGNLFQGAIKNLRLQYPPSKEERLGIVDKVRFLSKTIESKQLKIKSLKTLKTSLMQNLLTGNVRVDVEKINKLLEKAQ